MVELEALTGTRRHQLRLAKRDFDPYPLPLRSHPFLFKEGAKNPSEIIGIEIRDTTVRSFTNVPCVATKQL